MADSTISGLPLATVVNGTDVVPIDQSGQTKKALISSLVTAANSASGVSAVPTPNNPGANVQAQLNNLGGGTGASFIGAAATSLNSGTVQQQLNNLSGSNGSAFVGATAGGQVTGTTVASQLAYLQGLASVVYLGQASTTDTLTFTTTTGYPTSYFDGLTIAWRPQGPNTASPLTININGLGATPIKKNAYNVAVSEFQLVEILFATYVSSLNSFQLIGNYLSANSDNNGQLSAFVANNNLVQGSIDQYAYVTAGFVQQSIQSGVRNRLINGTFQVDQRNSGSAQTITTTLAYTVDRWFASATTGNVTGQRVAKSGGTGYLYQITGAASNTSVGFGQRIEASNCQDLAGQTVTLSVSLANSLLTSVNWAVSYATATDNWAGNTQVATGTFTVTASLTRYNTTFTLPTAAVTGLQVQFTVLNQVSGTWQIEDAMFELGSFANILERLPYSQVLNLCRRYLPVLESTAIGNALPGYTNGTTTGLFVWQLSVPSRVPATSVSTPAVGDWFITNGSGVAGPLTGISLNTAGVSSISIATTSTAGSPTLAAGQGSRIYANTAGSPIFALGCEL